MSNVSSSICYIFQRYKSTHAVNKDYIRESRGKFFENYRPYRLFLRNVECCLTKHPEPFPELLILAVSLLILSAGWKASMVYLCRYVETRPGETNRRRKKNSLSTDCVGTMLKHHVLNQTKQIKIGKVAPSSFFEN